MSETTFERYKEVLEKTTITEKLDYKTLLIYALRTVETSILSGDKYIIESSIWTLYNLIPASWYDDSFKKDIADCYVTEKKDVRPVVAGDIRMSEDVCKKLGITAYREEKRTNHFKMLSACICLLERLGVLMRRTPKAWISGRSGVVLDGENRVR